MTNDTTTVRTPRHLWIVGILALLWNAVGAFDYLMTQYRVESYMSQYTQEQLDFFYGFPAWVEGAWAIAVWGAVAGSILLLMRRRAAVWLFAVSLAGMVVTTFHNYVLGDGLAVMGGAGPLIFSVVIFLVGVFLVVYARAMARRGVLT